MDCQPLQSAIEAAGDLLRGGESLLFPQLQEECLLL